MRSASSTAILSSALVLIVGCQRYYQTSVSVDHSRKRGLLNAEYAIPNDGDLGEYQVLEVWAETDRDSAEQHLVVRLKGPHHDTEPRVHIVGLDETQYRSIWSERNGPPYEVWAAPYPLPNVLRLKRGDKQVNLIRREE